MPGFSNYVRKCGLEDSLINLVYLRALQINGCAYCIDMHWQSCWRRKTGLYGLDAWEESIYCSDRERAAPAWTESVASIVGFPATTNAPLNLRDTVAVHQ